MVLVLPSCAVIQLSGSRYTGIGVLSLLHDGMNVLKNGSARFSFG